MVLALNLLLWVLTLINLVLLVWVLWGAYRFITNG